MGQSKVTLTDCSYNLLCRLAEKHSFILVQGKKHCKIRTAEGKFVTLIPRHTTIKRETALGIVESMNKAGAKIIYER